MSLPKLVELLSNINIFNYYVNSKVLDFKNNPPAIDALLFVINDSKIYNLTSFYETK